MSTNLEPIKQQILELIQHDPDVKYIFLGWMTDQFVPKTDYSKLLDEIKQLRENMQQGFAEHKAEMQALREESNRRFEENRLENARYWEENNKRWEESDRRWEESDRRWEESDRRWEESDKHFGAIRQEIKELRTDMQQENQKLRTDMQQENQKLRTDMQQEGQKLRTDMQHGFQRLERKIGRLGTRWGLHAETSFRESLASILTDFAEADVTLWRTEDEAGHVYKVPCPVELDVVVANGQCLVVAEIKSLANRNDIITFYRVTEVYEKKTEIVPNRRILIAAEVEPSARKLAERLGVEVFAVDEDGE